jgi:metal-responsive CopG/Arc/MetJ family transcriptional regulator
MKTAVSVPDNVFKEAERYARKAGKTRSQLYSEALRQYLLHHAPDAVTQAMDEAIAMIDQREDTFAQAASRRMLRRESW